MVGIVLENPTDLNSPIQSGRYRHSVLTRGYLYCIHLAIKPMAIREYRVECTILKYIEVL